MADDATHARHKRMGWIAFFAFLILVSGISLHQGTMTALGLGAFLVAVLGYFT